ncbi:MAG: helix-turn-helix transcriptional regulator [Propionicimonas sp.]|uniref:helix-turn-helix transcriptional regulator n=1 Tax=Propionicimonas sp. TaxID=1955623 RepID=UPI002B20DA77|nr:helix-turn-helix transcriptional regulator [Propionicimonas sp.]MEA4943898.1 helix-turn-helix transcriptional regulator [Propionicimonas sp.]MEA5052107.1 helix-turn-helix transcriptional regulator [Propionicimonas sp.]MEA5119094.1 helix-turn-helix transcriptional regulator [Propionicimonas sp.]
MNEALVRASDTTLSRVVLGPRSKYLGLTTLLAWHYCLWFVPSAFPNTFLLDDRITFSWLIALAAAGVVPLVLAFQLGPRRHLGATPALVWSAAGLGALGTGVLASVGMMVASPWIAYLSAFVIGSCAGVLWVLWGERLACHRARFTLQRVAPMYGGFLLGVVATTYLLPGWSAVAFVCLLPLLSGLLLHVHVRALPDARYPSLLPAKVATEGRSTMVVVTVISFAAAFVCYYTVAIVPWEALGVVQDSFTVGILLGGALILFFALGQRLSPKRRSAYRVYPWLLMFSVVACVLYLTDERLHVVSFLLALAISSLFEILITTYMGVLTLRGYAPPATAFALSSGAIRLGICLGNGTALLYERVPGLHQTLTRPTFVLLVVLMSGLVISMVRQEYAIEELIRTPQAESALATIVSCVAEEFRLSEREREILGLIGQGYTAAAVAEKLVISPYTVNTHIQHIYGKLGIHKRSELISYLHRRD